MIGTEKQVAWAENIVRTIRNIFDGAEKAQANHSMIKQVKEMHNKIIENKKRKKAREIIDDFKDVCQHGESKVLEDYNDVINLIVVCELTKGRNYRNRRIK